jgi:hypothetical protein
MKKLLAAILLMTTLSTTAFAACEWVDGYFRKDGTYVEGHWRGCK